MLGKRAVQGVFPPLLPLLRHSSKSFSWTKCGMGQIKFSFSYVGSSFRVMFRASYLPCRGRVSLS